MRIFLIDFIKTFLNTWQNKVDEYNNAWINFHFFWGGLCQYSQSSHRFLVDRNFSFKNMFSQEYIYTVVIVCSISSDLNGVIIVLSFGLFNCADCRIDSKAL